MTRRELAALFTLLAASFVSAIARNAHLPSGAAVSEALSHNDSHTTLFSSDNYLKCTSSVHLSPRSTAELIELIRLHAARGFKIRATRRGFHSSAGFVCSGRRSSSKRAHRVEEDEDEDAVTAVTVLLHLMNRAVEVDPALRRVTVEAGMTLLELVTLAEKHAMAVPPGALSMYSGLTVGGAVMAGAHGSGLGSVSALSDLVTAVKVVDARGQIIVSEEVPVVLGLLGIATEFTLQLRGNSRTVVETRWRGAASDGEMVEDLRRILARETPHVLVHWRPDSGAYKAVLMSDVGDGVAPTFYPHARRASDAPVDERHAAEWSNMMVAWEEDSSEILNADICRLGQTLLNAPLHTDATGAPLPHGTFPTNSAVVTGDCSPRCLFNVHHTSIFTDDTEFTIAFSQLQDWVRDVKTVVETELEGGKLCMPPGYFWLRFGQGSSRLFSTNVGSEDVVYVQWTFWHSAMVPGKLPKRSAVAETLEQLTLCKYKGRPHWGKNHERVFRHPKCKVVENYPSGSIAGFREAQRRHDPGKVFEPALFGEVLEGAGPEYYPRCVVDFWCYCESDSHCSEGFTCGASRSFPEYMVCRAVQREEEYDEL